MTTDLTSRVRDGDLDAYGHLFATHHADATRVARRYAGAQIDTDELVATAFDNTLTALLHGHGPGDTTFLPYLRVAMRRAAAQSLLRARH
ncbi:RNA polymerase sigma factor [Amycolatopsis cihanbeyliensis]|uniref:Uncharacterized protein n=1 Tax=Amycolatopsis cihanbeyliensis TaxID=1128664 RepID=A0A542CV09_AMYCI|nr:hypothetical protein [Amycolatopsis cihanbeyliensis]TQI94653.1 hypothetical protein FB471_6825 [Amycolatopsis cihanbeyliensis]